MAGLQSLAFHPDGKLIASEGRDRRLILWDLEAGREVWSVDDPAGTGRRGDPDGSNSRIAFTEDGKRLAAFGYFWTHLRPRNWIGMVARVVSSSAPAIWHRIPALATTFEI